MDNQKKRVSKRKLVKKKKERGKYVSKKSIGLGDTDLAECLFSDEEMGAAFVDSQQVDLIGEIGAHHDCDKQSEDVGDLSEDPSSSSALSDSRPSSAASCQSATDSSLANESTIDLGRDFNDVSESSDSSRPASSASGTLSRPVSAAACDLPLVLGASNTAEENLPEFHPTNALISDTVQALKSGLPSAWIPIADQSAVHLLFVSPGTPKAVQREVVLFYNGMVSIYVHCQPMLDKKVLTLNSVPPLTSIENVREICEKSLKIINTVMSYDICVGANHESTRFAWSTIPDTYVDLNPFKESGYTETCRSNACHYLVKYDRSRKFVRCTNCYQILQSLRRREENLLKERASPFANNAHLTLQQAIEKINVQHEEIRKKDKRIAYLEKRVKELLEKEGVDLEMQVSNDLAEILKNTNLTPIQKLFLEEQIKAGGQKNPRCRRWHPTLIRFALHIRMQSASAYEAIRDSGLIVLPTSRTLYDYSHAITPQDGISDGILKMVQADVKKKPKEFQKYHCLLIDEVYISKNLVWRQSDNTLFGYANINEVEKEVAHFESYVEARFTGIREEPEPEVAKTMLAFMVKGIATDVKYVVAAYPMSAVTSDAIYCRTWQVISRLEKAEVKVLVVVCDGAPTNRTFIGMHTPITKTSLKIIFDTKNFCSPEGRPLFFILDVCHVLKTARNCFYNSGENEKKKPRCMEVNGEKVVWKTIVRLYMTFKNSNFRKSYKLNALNVFPNAFSCMKVRPAAQVLSDTVANDIEDQKWPGTTETVRFIRYFNKFFDCLNTAYKDQGKRTKNPSLEPYTSVDDVRFSWLGVPNPGHEGDHGDELPFLQYLKMWQTQVDAMKITSREKERKKLSWQSFHSLETSIRGFAVAVRFLLQLKEPPKFILGRAFSQDPLEQHFSLQRAGCGGSRNPNALQFITKQHSLAIQRDIGVKTRKGNVESVSGGMKITEEPLPKRPRVSKSNSKK